jgi:hypothetical protein
MNEDWIRENFAQLRRADERQAPSFAETWEAANSRAGRHAEPAFRLATAAAAIVLLIGATWLVRGRPPARPAAQLSQWRSPTASLLETPGLQLLRTTPRLGEPFGIGTVMREREE